MRIRTFRRDGYARGAWWVKLYSNGIFTGMKAFPIDSSQVTDADDWDNALIAAKTKRDAWIKDWVKEKVD